MTRCNASLMVDRVIEAGHGQKVAYASLGDDLSYEELHRSINRMGNLLHELGVRREERVLLVLDNTTTFPIVFLGALRVGAVPVPVSVLETDANLRHVVEDSYTETRGVRPVLLAPRSGGVGKSERPLPRAWRGP